MSRIITVLFKDFLKSLNHSLGYQLFDVILYNKFLALSAHLKSYHSKQGFLSKNILKFCSRTLENVLGIVNIQMTWTSLGISSKSFSLNTVQVQIHPLPSGEQQAKFLGPLNLLAGWGGVQETDTWMHALLRPAFFSRANDYKNEQSY